MTPRELAPGGLPAASRPCRAADGARSGEPGAGSRGAEKACEAVAFGRGALPRTSPEGLGLLSGPGPGLQANISGVRPPRGAAAR